jgi:predicted nucleotidyltransferase
MKYKEKLIKTADLRAVLDLLKEEKISFSCAAETLSNMAELRLLLSQKIKSEETNYEEIEKAYFEAYSNPLPLWRAIFCTSKDNSAYLKERVKELLKK